MVKKIDEQYLLIIFIFLTWATMWISINAHPWEMGTHPEHKGHMSKSVINFINGSRSIAVILASLLSFVLLFFLIILKNIKKPSIVLILFALYFIFQLIGIITNEERTTDLHSTYLVLYSLGTISLLMIVDIQKIYKVLPYLGYFSLTILAVAYFLVLTQSGDSFTKILQGNLYSLFHPDEMIFYQAPPRITGLTRSFGIISLTLLMILFHKKRTNILSPIIFSLVIVLSMFVWTGQSRGSILCYYLTVFFFIIFLNNLNQFKKFLTIISITLFSIVFSNEIVNFAAKNMLKKNSIGAEETILLGLHDKTILDEDLKTYLKKRNLYSKLQKIEELEINSLNSSLSKGEKDKISNDLLVLKKGPEIKAWLNNIKKIENNIQNNSTDSALIQTMKNKLNELSNVNKLNNNLENKFSQSFKFYNSPRIFEERAGSYTSGRVTLWKRAIDKYEKNRIFGYGPQADRVLLHDPTDFDSGNNVSNAMIYALLSGGYFSLLTIMLIYIYTAYIVLNFF